MYYTLSKETIKVIVDAVKADAEKAMEGDGFIGAGPQTLLLHKGGVSFDLLQAFNQCVNGEVPSGKGELRSIRKHLKAIVKMLDDELGA